MQRKYKLPSTGELSRSQPRAQWCACGEDGEHCLVTNHEDAPPEYLNLCHRCYRTYLEAKYPEAPAWSQAFMTIRYLDNIIANGWA